MAKSAAMSYSMRWTSSPITAIVQPARARANALRTALREILSPIAEQIQSAMRANARWTDRTGRARAGLVAVVRSAGTRVTIVAGSTAPYGIWLEVRWGGRYAVIVPTMESFYGEVHELMVKAATL